MIRNILILCIYLFIVSCQRSNEEATDKTLQIVQDSIMKVDKLKSEDFDAFYDKFISDTIFQKTRLKFPMNGGDFYCDTTFSWSEKDWEYMSWDYREPINEDIDSLSVSSNDSERIIQMHRKEIGLISEFIFANINGQWLLVKLTWHNC